MNKVQHMDTHRCTTPHTIVAFLLFISLIYLCSPYPAGAEASIKQTTLSDGVEFWCRAETGNTKPWFWEQIEKLVNAVIYPPL